MLQDRKLKTHFQKVIQPIEDLDLFLIYKDDNQRSMTYENLLKLAAVHEKEDGNDVEDDIWQKIKNPNEDRSLKSTMPQYCILENGTCFDKNSKGWNLAKFSATESVIHALPENEWMDGIHKPYIYLGMYGTTFTWHREDRNFMSINYLHDGSTKLWYTVPFECSDRFERVIQEEIENISLSKRSSLNINCNLAIRHKVVHVPPSFLKKHDIKFGKVISLY